MTEGASLSASIQSGAPQSYALYPAAPNPTQERAEIAFDVPEPADVRLVVIDMLGREVAVLTDGPMEAGSHRATFESEALPPGVYIVRMQTRSWTATRQLTLVR